MVENANLCVRSKSLCLSLSLSLFSLSLIPSCVTGLTSPLLRYQSCWSSIDLSFTTLSMRANNVVSVTMHSSELCFSTLLSKSMIELDFGCRSFHSICNTVPSGHSSTCAYKIVLFNCILENPCVT